ncbi:MAG: CRISPR-associated helicase Cas3' [Limnothrix sp. BL-A-16]
MKKTPIKTSQPLARPNQLLTTHLQETANFSKQIIAPHSPPSLQSIAYLIGALHDLGKANPQWQAKLNRPNSALHDRVPHAAHGAWVALEQLNRNPEGATAKAIAHCIAAHHTRLRNWGDREGKIYETETVAQTCWDLLRQLDSELHESILQAAANSHELPHNSQGEMTVRLLYSALIEADRCSAAAIQPAAFPASLLLQPSPPAPVCQPKDQWRNLFAQHCQRLAEQPPGWYRITGPCGVGKTQASAQAIAQHIQHNQMRGLIFVGPLKSVIEQTAHHYRRWFGAEQVLEHHGDFDSSQDADYRDRCARWNSPVICTSGAQFFDSLLSDRAGRCRKLQQLIGRAIVIDEAQYLPPHLAVPVLSALNTLVQQFGCTVVLMSATNPAFSGVAKVLEEAGSPLPPWVDVVQPDEVKSLFAAMTTTSWRLGGPMNWNAIAKDVQSAGCTSVATIVNTTALARTAAIQLQESLADWTIAHLSARMYPQHRGQTIQAVRQVIQRGDRILLVGTQVIEAGVDLDFQRLYTQMAPLDSLLQRAGRCDRNGCHPGSVVTIFETGQAFDVRQTDIAVTRPLLEKAIASTDGMLEAIDQFYRTIYSRDRIQTGIEIERLRHYWQFGDVADRAKTIEEGDRIRVVIPNSDLDLAKLSNQKLTWKDWREISRYSVSIPLKYQKSIEFCANGLPVWRGGYDQFGWVDP